MPAKRYTPFGVTTVPGEAEMIAPSLLEAARQQQELLLAQQQADLKRSLAQAQLALDRERMAADREQFGAAQAWEREKFAAGREESAADRALRLRDQELKEKLGFGGLDYEGQRIGIERDRLTQQGQTANRELDIRASLGADEMDRFDRNLAFLQHQFEQEYSLKKGVSAAEVKNLEANARVAEWNAIKAHAEWQRLPTIDSMRERERAITASTNAEAEYRGAAAAELRARAEQTQFETETMRGRVGAGSLTRERAGEVMGYIDQVLQSSGVGQLSHGNWQSGLMPKDPTSINPESVIALTQTVRQIAAANPDLSADQIGSMIRASQVGGSIVEESIPWTTGPWPWSRVHTDRERDALRDRYWKTIDGIIASALGQR